MNEISETSAELRLSQLERDMGDIKISIRDIAESLRTLIRLEEQHAVTRNLVLEVKADNEKFREKFREKVDTQIKDLDNNIRSIQLELPTLQLVAKWVKAGVIGVVSLVGLAVLANVGLG